MTITRINNPIIAYYVAACGDFVGYGTTRTKAIENVMRQLGQIYG